MIASLVSFVGRPLTAPLSYARLAAMSTSSQQSLHPIKLDPAFFPSPSLSTYPLAPRWWPGVSSETQSELANLLRQNNEHFHIYFNDKGFHNHLSHHLFAIYALGTSPQVLTAAYRLHADYQRPAYQSPKPIDESNWNSNLNKWDYYNAYMHFYASEITKHGAPQTLQKYVFSKEANLNPDGSLGPQMLNRFMSSLLHPIIHTGHWAEFEVPGMLAEGLAMASVTAAQTPQLFPPEFFQFTSASAVKDDLSHQAQQKLTLDPPSGGVHALSILQEMLNDPELAAGKPCSKDSENKFSDTVRNVGDRIHRYASQWQVDTEREVPDKIEELAWLATLVYGLGGWRKGKEFRSDFFLLHLVTSSIFIPSLISKLPFHDQSVLLRAHLAVILTWWVSRGRPAIPIEEYYSLSASDLSPLLPSPLLSIKPDESAIGIPSSTKPLPSNMWLPMLESCLNHPEEHLIKNQRALAHFDHLYGQTPQGFFHGKTKLRGAELLDGTLFWRVALHTMKTHGWVREGEPLGEFDRAGLGWDELW